MAMTSATFIPEVWSKSLLETFKQEITINMLPKRSYGARLLRAAAKGEDWTKIKREVNIREEYANDAADALAYQLDADILNSLRNGK
jgi:hypothetical protein